MLSASCWSTKEVRNWLEEEGFEDYSDLLCNRHKIDGQVLLSLTESDLLNPPISIGVFGDARRLCNSINKISCFVRPRLTTRSENKGTHTESDGTSDEELTRIVSSGTDLWTTGYEFRRVFLSFVYLFVACYTSAIVMTIVHNRVPDMQKFPPLPDIILDCLPLIPWAFKASEVIMICHFFTWVVTLFYHRHRFILLKRWCNIFGSVFFMRCCTLLFTSLSVPGTHHACIAQSFTGWKATLKRSIEIMSCGGLSVTGIRSCGDYMFSGHTVVHTLSCLFLVEYTSNKLKFLHLTSKVFTAFGLFFILAAHEHYTLDVICAFYVSIKTFTHYHLLITAHKVNKRRTKCWNPVFYFMEKPLELANVPNEYEAPTQALKRWFNNLRTKKHHQT